jgi:hypothetical protein
MANRKISELDEAGALDGSELVEVVQNGSNRQATVAAIKGQPLIVNFGMGSAWDSGDSFSALVDEQTISSPSPDIAFDPNGGSARLVVTTPGVYRVTITCQVGPSSGDWPAAIGVLGVSCGSSGMGGTGVILPDLSGVPGAPGSARWTSVSYINTSDSQGPYGISFNAAFLSEIPGIDMQVSGTLVAERITTPA